MSRLQTYSKRSQITYEYYFYFVKVGKSIFSVAKKLLGRYVSPF